MKKRAIILGTYDTAQLWTLCECKLTDPEQQTNFVNVVGGIPLDFSTALTDGEPSYNSRSLTARLECSEGTRQTRKDWISEMVNALDGQRLNIVHPDYPAHYLTGRVRVTVDYNTLAHASVTVTATCEPWLYSNRERAYTLTAADAEQVAVLTNSGRRALVPQVTITGAGASVRLVYGSISYALGPGTFTLPDLYLRQGDTLLTYSGTGTAVITYREAVLQ